VFRCVLGSEGCVLVPRSIGTPVATWASPTWVVSRRRVLEAVFILLKFSSPSRRIFIGSHSLPPSLVSRIGPSRGQVRATWWQEQQDEVEDGFLVEAQNQGRAGTSWEPSHEWLLVEAMRTVCGLRTGGWSLLTVNSCMKVRL
jgi:hypothetical protein